MEQTCAVANEAMVNMQSATMSVGYSESYVNANRNYTYREQQRDGSVMEYTSVGKNLRGFSERTLTIMGSLHYADCLAAIEDATEAVSDVTLGYAVGTTSIPGRTVTQTAGNPYDTMGRGAEFEYSDGPDFYFDLQVLRIGGLLHLDAAGLMLLNSI